MARGRSDKSKSTPLDKSVNKKVNKKKKMKAGQAGDSNAESVGLVRGEDSAQHHSLEPAATPTERAEQEPSADLDEMSILSEEILSTPSPENGHQGEDDAERHRRIAERAFMLFQENGCEHGNDWAHWFEAERQIRV